MRDFDDVSHLESSWTDQITVWSQRMLTWGLGPSIHITWSSPTISNIWQNRKLCLSLTHHVCQTSALQIASHTLRCCRSVFVHAISIEPEFRHFRGRTASGVLSLRCPKCLLCNALRECRHIKTSTTLRQMHSRQCHFSFFRNCACGLEVLLKIKDEVL